MNRAILGILVLMLVLYAQPVTAQQIGLPVDVYKYNDVNQNGQNDNEPYLDDWMIRVYDQNWDFDQQSPTTIGLSTFNLLTDQDYYFCEELRENWTQSQPSVAGGTAVTNLSKATDEANLCYVFQFEERDDEQYTFEFGNYFTEPESGEVLGETTDDGSVLGADILAKTGDETILAISAGLLFIFSALLLAKRSKSI